MYNKKLELAPEYLIKGEVVHTLKCHVKDVKFHYHLAEGKKNPQ
jgi:hypothetical protein